MIDYKRCPECGTVWPNAWLSVLPPCPHVANPLRPDLKSTPNRWHDQYNDLENSQNFQNAQSTDSTDIQGFIEKYRDLVGANEDSTK